MGTSKKEKPLTRMCLTCLNEEAGDHAFIGEKIDYGYYPKKAMLDTKQKESKVFIQAWKIVAIRVEKSKIYSKWNLKKIGKTKKSMKIQPAG